MSEDLADPDDPGPTPPPAGTVALLSALTATGRAVFASAACSVALVTAEGDALQFVAATGEGADEVVGMRLPLGRGIAGWVAGAGQSVLVADVTRDARFARDVAEQTGYVPDAIMAAPIESAGATVGVIEVLDPSADHQPDAGFDLLGRLADQAAAAVRVGGVADGIDPAADPDLDERFSAVAALGGAERQAAIGMLDAFLGYARRPARRR